MIVAGLILSKPVKLVKEAFFDILRNPPIEVREFNPVKLVKEALFSI